MSIDASAAPDYVGHDELLVLETARNYNRHIAGQFAAVLPRLGVFDAAPRVIDFGAGIGTISTLFRGATGIAPLAVEVDAHQRRVLQERGLETTPGLESIPDASVDFVFSSNVMEHIEDDVKILKEVHRTLRPGGHVALWIPAVPILWTSLDDRVGHHRRYTQATALATLRAAGFSAFPVCCYQDCVGFALAYLFRFIGSKDGTLSPGPVRLFDRWLFPLSKQLDGLCRDWFGKNVYVVAVKG